MQAHHGCTKGNAYYFLLNKSFLSIPARKRLCQGLCICKAAYVSVIKLSRTTMRLQTPFALALWLRGNPGTLNRKNNLETYFVSNLALV